MLNHSRQGMYIEKTSPPFGPGSDLITGRLKTSKRAHLAALHCFPQAFLKPHFKWDRPAQIAKVASYAQPNSRLPNELVTAIIDIVADLDTLRALALVCHNWLSLCQSLIHEIVVIDERGARGAMTKKDFLRIYSKYRHLSQYVLDVSFKLARSTKTNPFHPCLLRFTQLRSLHLENYPDPYEFRRGVLSPSMVSLIPQLLVSSTLTRLSLVGFTPPTILDLLCSDEVLRTNLRSLALLEVFRPEWETQMNPHPVHMVGLHELEIDHITSFDVFAIETPSLRTLSAVYRTRDTLPQTCPTSITNLTLKLLLTPSWTSATASSLQRLTRLETLTLEAKIWEPMNYTYHFPWLSACVRHIKDVCPLRRLEIQLRDQGSFRTLSPLDFSSFDGLLSEMHHGQSLREVSLKLTPHFRTLRFITPHIINPMPPISSMRP